MPLEPVTQVSGRAVFIPGADIDTDRIIPARFMKCVTFDGLGEFAFYDVRFNPKPAKRPTIRSTTRDSPAPPSSSPA